MSQAILVAGMGYGDEGKGATVDYLTRCHKAGLVVRYNGGAQCGHNVVTPDGRWHTFSQFGSGTFVPGTKTHLSRFVIINPLRMMVEEVGLQGVGVTDAWQRTTIEEGALVITPYHVVLNKIRQSLSGKKNSCGIGIGETRQDHFEYGDSVLFAGDLKDEKILRSKLEFHRMTSAAKVQKMLQEAKSADEAARILLLAAESGAFTPESVGNYTSLLSRWPGTIVKATHLGALLEQTETTIFEGAQGILLDETHGEDSYNTWTDTTFNNAQVLLRESGFYGSLTKIGVTRIYATRHGDGPLDTEDADLLKHLPEPHNADDGPQGKFRVGHFNISSFIKARDICGGLDGLAVNHVDRVSLELDLRACFSNGTDLVSITNQDRVAPAIEILFGIPVLFTGHGPTAEHRKEELDHHIGGNNEHCIEVEARSNG